MNRLKAGWPKGKKKSGGAKGAAPSSLAAYGPGAPPLQFQRSSQTLPPLIEDSLAWLETHQIWEVEGIFRISGDFHEIKHLLRKYAKGKKVKLEEETTGMRAHTIACLLKTYLRELPIPLLTFELYETFLSAISIADEKARLELIKTTIALLPPANKALLTRLLALMRKVADHADVNKMHAQNLAIVFAPCLLRPANDNLMTALLDGGVSQTLLSVMIQNYSYFFIEKHEATETTKQLAGEYKDFYKTLKKGTLRLAASIVEEKKLLQRLKEGDEADEMDVDSGTHAKPGNVTSGVDDAGMEALSPELKRFAAEAEEHIRRRPTSPRGHAGKPLPPPPRRTIAMADGKVEASNPSVAAQTVDTQVSEEPERTDMAGSGSKLNTTRKGSGTQRAKKVETAEEMKPTAKQISMSWNPSQARRELSAAEKADQASIEPAGRGVIAEIAQERPRSPHVHVAAIRQRLKMSAVSSSSSSDDSDSDDDSDRKAPSHLVRSAPAAPSTTTSSSSDSEEERRPTSRSLKSSIRDRFRSDSDSDSRDEDDSSGEEKKEEDAEDSEVVKKRTMTYLTPEQMVKLVRQQRAQQRKELLSKKKKQKAKKNSASKELKKTRKRRDSESDASESDSDEDSSSNSSEDDEETPTSPSKPSPSEPDCRSAPSVPPKSSKSASSSSEDEDDEEQVQKLLQGDLGYFERLVAPQVTSGTQESSGGQSDVPDLAALAKNADLHLERFQ